MTTHFFQSVFVFSAFCLQDRFWKVRNEEKNAKIILGPKIQIMLFGNEMKIQSNLTKKKNSISKLETSDKVFRAIRKNFWKERMKRFFLFFKMIFELNTSNNFNLTKNKKKKISSFFRINKIKIFAFNPFHFLLFSMYMKIFQLVQDHKASNLLLTFVVSPKIRPIPKLLQLKFQS